MEDPVPHDCGLMAIPHYLHVLQMTVLVLVMVFLKVTGLTNNLQYLRAHGLDIFQCLLSTLTFISVECFSALIINISKALDLPRSISNEKLRL